MFVTHDIDEAIKMGDRIAIHAATARSSQYDTPRRSSPRPADAFVEAFVGADRALKRLALIPAADLMTAGVLGTGAPRNQPPMRARVTRLAAMLAAKVRTRVTLIDGRWRAAWNGATLAAMRTRLTPARMTTAAPATCGSLPVH